MIMKPFIPLWLLLLGTASAAEIHKLEGRSHKLEGRFALIPSKYRHEDPRVNEAIDYLHDLLMDDPRVAVDKTDRKGRKWIEETLEGQGNTKDNKDNKEMDLNCDTIKHAYTLASAADPENLVGSIMEGLNQGCVDKSIETPEEIKEFGAKMQAEQDPNIDNQFERIAKDTCANYDTGDIDIDTSSIKEACENETFVPELIVDAAYAVQQQLMPANNTNTEDMQLACQDLENHREEINAAMMDLAVSTERKHGRSLDEITALTGHKIGEEVITMLECICDESNPTNKGCTRKSITVVEHIGQVISDQADKDFAPGGSHEDMMEDMVDLRATLERETRHLRPSNPAHTQADSSDSDMAIALANSKHQIKADLDVGKCKPPIVQETLTGVKVCIYAGSLFDCGLSQDRVYSGCINMGECGGGKFLKLRAAVKYCPPEQLKLEFKLCIDVISDVLGAIGQWIGWLEGLMNSIGIWGGCYRLSEATYDIRNERFEVTVPEHSHWAYHANIFVAVGGHTRIRFKGWGCPYQDVAWYQRDWWVHHLAQGDGSTIDNFGTFIWAYFTPVFEHMQGRTCEWGTAGWAQVTLTFRVYMDWGWFGESTLYDYKYGWKIHA